MSFIAVCSPGFSLLLAPLAYFRPAEEKLATYVRAILVSSKQTSFPPLRRSHLSLTLPFPLSLSISLSLSLSLLPLFRDFQAFRKENPAGERRSAPSSRPSLLADHVTSSRTIAQELQRSFFRRNFRTDYVVVVITRANEATPASGG